MPKQAYSVQMMKMSLVEVLYLVQHHSHSLGVPERTSNLSGLHLFSKTSLWQLNERNKKLLGCEKESKIESQKMKLQIPWISELRNAKNKMLMLKL